MIDGEKECLQIQTPSKSALSIPEKNELVAETPALEKKRERVIRELSLIAFGDIRKLYHSDGSLKKIGELEPETAAALSGVDVSTISKTDGDGSDFDVTIKKVKRWDKVKALELLAKHYGLIRDDKNITVNVTLEALVAASFKK